MSLVMDEMTRTERVMAAVMGDEVDRIPVCFWHHFKPNGSGRKMAEATINFFEADFDLDIIKIMPDLPYPFPRLSLRDTNDWRLVEPIDIERSRFFRQRAVAIQALRDGRPYLLDVREATFGIGADVTWYQKFSLAEAREKKV